LRVEALEPLSRGAAARHRPFDWQAGHGIADTEVHLRPRGLIVVDGVYSPRPELAHLVSLAVLVETHHRNKRLLRIAARGPQNEAWHARWEAAEDHYLRDVLPRVSFDLVVAGD